MEQRSAAKLHRSCPNLVRYPTRDPWPTCSSRSTTIARLNHPASTRPWPHQHLSVIWIRAKKMLPFESRFWKKDSKYGSRRELPALGVSGVVSKGRPSIFEFWENMLGPQPDQITSMTPGESSDANENNSGSRASMRRVLPPLPGQPQSLTVSTTASNNGPTELLGSRGEVEGSSNQPSPTCVTGEIDPGYWSAVRSNNCNHDELNTTSVKISHHDLLIDDLNRTKKQLAELQNMVSPWRLDHIDCERCG